MIGGGKGWEDEVERKRWRKRGWERNRRGNERRD
jgi:hypothetical protein